MKKKTIIALILTLLIGFVIGFFLSGRLAHNRMKHIRKVMESPKMEQEFLAKRLKLSEKQVEQITPILDSMLPKQMEIRKRHRAEMDSVRNQMFDKIQPFLNEKQVERVKKMKNKQHRKRPPFPRK